MGFLVFCMYSYLVKKPYSHFRFCWLVFAQKIKFIFYIVLTTMKTAKVHPMKNKEAKKKRRRKSCRTSSEKNESCSHNQVYIEAHERNCSPISLPPPLSPFANFSHPYLSARSLDKQLWGCLVRIFHHQPFFAFASLRLPFFSFCNDIFFQRMNFVLQWFNPFSHFVIFFSTFFLFIIPYQRRYFI